jgi:hypothetical protein
MTKMAETLKMTKISNVTRKHSIRLADRGICEGNCDQHVGPIKVVHITAGATPFDKTNFGFRSYCRSAIAADRANGLFVEMGGGWIND